MAPKRGPKKEAAEAPPKVERKRKGRSGAGPSGEASPAGRVTRRSKPVLVESRLEELPDIRRRKRAKVATKEEGKPVAAEENDAPTIVVEFCKQCNSIKTRAMQVQAGLEAGLPGLKVVLNPDKPRFGCFEIREEGGDAFFTLLDMKRPFKDLKAVNIDELVSTILEKLK